MIQDNIRTLGVILAGFVALIVLGQSAQHLTVTAAVVTQPTAIQKVVETPIIGEAASVKKAVNQLVAIPKEKCASTWVNGGNYVLVTPQTCNDVAITSLTVAVSDKPCDSAKDADFQNLNSSTYFKGDYGFYVGQGRHVQCVAVKEIVGKYL